MTKRAIAQSLLLTLVLGFSLGARAQEHVLENESVRLVISGKDASILQLVHKASGTNYVADPAQARLFRFLMPQPGYLARRVDSRDQTVDEITVEGDTLTARFSQMQISPKKYIFQVGVFDVPEPQLPIAVTVTFRLDGEHIQAGMEVENRSLDQITDVTFPWIAGLPQKLADAPARIVLPSLGQKVFTSSTSFFTGERGQRFPGLLATTWMSYEAGRNGLGLEVRSTAETQDALVSLTPHTVHDTSPSYWGPPDFPYIGWNFYPHIAGQSTWSSPEIVIHVHAQDWRSVASEHREWYRKRHGATMRGHLRTRIGFATYRLKEYDETINWTYNDIPALARTTKEAGLEHMVILGWRQHESPANPLPFGEVADPRLGGASELRRAIGEAQQQGTELFFAFHPALLNPVGERARTPRFQWPVKTRRQGHQNIATHTFMTSDYPYSDHLRHAWLPIDPATGATGVLLGEAQRVREEYGFRNLFLRRVGLHSFLSYNQENGVLPQQAYLVGYNRLLGGLQKLFPDGMLMMEGLNDLVNPFSSVGYTWDQAENGEVLALSLPWVPFSTDIEALEYEKANRAFARGILLNVVVDGGQGTISDYAEFTRHLRALQELKSATSAYYAQAEFRDQEGLQGLQADEAVTVAVFQNVASGQTGVVLANAAGEAREVSFQLSRPAGAGRLVRLNGQRQNINAGRQVRVRLAPMEVAILCVDPRQR